jgi:hypothetical protein
MRRLLAALFVFLLALPARAEIWPSLEDFVGMSVAIVKARTVAAHGDDREFAITELWAGSLEEIEVNDRGNYLALQGEHGATVEMDQEIVFFFTRSNQRPNAKIERHSAAFAIAEERLIYAPTSDDHRREYTVEQFKETVIELSKAGRRE